MLEPLLVEELVLSPLRLVEVLLRAKTEAAENIFEQVKYSVLQLALARHDIIGRLPEYFALFLH